MKKLFLLSILALIGCASAPSPISDLKAVPSKRLLRTAISESFVGSGTIVIKTDAAPLQLACPYKFYLDGQPIAEIHRGEFLKFYATIGEHLFSVIVPAWCTMDISDQTIEIAAKVTSESDLKLRLGNDAWGYSTLNQTAF